MGKVPMSAFKAVIEVLLRTESRQAVKYLSPNMVVKATRRTYNRKRPRKDSTRHEVLITFGAPGYKERKFIHQAKAAQKLFPIRNVIYRQYR